MTNSPPPVQTPPNRVRQAFRTPAELNGHHAVHPVVIVGAGPVGLTVALTLARAGVRCVLLEDDDAVCSGSRALGMSRRTLEIWQALGAAARILAHGKPWHSGRSFYRGKTILDFKMADDLSLRHRPMFNIQQCHTEHYLVEALASRPEADIRWQSKLERLEQKADLVELQIGTPEGRYALRAQYVVACDGARSAVRSSLGLQLHGTSYDATYIIADIELDSERPMERRCWFDPPSNPGLTVLMHGQPDRLWRLDYQLGEGEDAVAAAQTDHVMRRVQQHLDYIGEKGRWRLEWASPYRVHSRALDSFIHGRIAFAGDAAHLMPIFGIRGLNSGVEDAWNLGCKLVQILDGRATPAVLEAYNQERRAVFQENAALANRNAVFMTPDGPGSRLARDAVLSLSLGETPVQDILNPKQATYVPLRASPLSTADEESWDVGPAPGEIAPDMVCAPGLYLHSALPTGHALLYFAGNAPEAEMRRVASALDEQAPQNVLVVTRVPSGGIDTLVDVQGTLHTHFGAEQGAIYLVRDDHHIAARWKHFDPGKIHLSLRRLQGYDPATTEGGVPVPAPGPSHAETVYRLLGEALNGIAPDAYPTFLSKLVMKLGLEQGDATAFEQAIRVARADLT